MTLTPADEGLHPAGGDPDWQESVYLAWRDLPSGLGGNHRIGNELNRATANLWCGVYREDGTRFRHNGEQLELERIEGGLCAGPQRLWHDGGQLRFLLDGDGARLELTITDDQGSLIESGSGSAPGGAIFSRNFHTFCRVRGTASLDGRSHEIDAPAWRDHSWGVRRWDSFLASRSFAGAVGDALRFRYASMVSADGGFFRHGALIRDGRPVPVEAATMLVHLDDDSVRCPAAELHLSLGGGGTTTVRIDTIGGMLGVTGRRHGWEAVGDVSVDGEGGGWGFLEVNNNPRNGNQAPAFVLGAGLTNGITR